MKSPIESHPLHFPWYRKACRLATPATLALAAITCGVHALVAAPPFLHNLEVEGNLTVLDGGETMDGVVFYGTFDGLSIIPENGPGTRFMWYPRKAALRAGQVTGTEWNDSAIGEYSLALGRNPVASGRAAVALGEEVGALGDGSFAVGYYSLAAGDGAFAAGYESYADGFGTFAAGVNGYVVGSASGVLGGDNTIFGESGNFAVGTHNVIDGSDRTIALGHANTLEFATDAMAIGRENLVGGTSSIAVGRNLDNAVYSSLVIGSYNAPLEGSEDAWASSDPLFVIGNGFSSDNRSNAVVVSKSGDMELLGNLRVTDDLVVLGNLSVEGGVMADIHFPDDLSVVGTIVSEGGITSRGRVEAEDLVLSEQSNSGEMVTAFSGSNRADSAGSGVRIELSNSSQAPDEGEPGATIDAVLQSDGSHDLIFSSASAGGFGEILRLRGSDRSVFIEGDARIDGNVALNGEVTIAHVPPRGGIMMGEFGYQE